MSADRHTNWPAFGCYLGVIGVLTLALFGGCPAGTTGGDGGGGEPNATAEPNEPSEPNETAEPNEPGEPNAPGAVTYQLTITIEGQGSVDPAGGNFDAAEAVTLTATAADGWRFDHWAGDLSGSDNPTTLTMDADRATTAIFTVPQASALTFYADYNQIVQDADVGAHIERAAMSTDGKKLAFVTGHGATGRKAYTVLADGTGRVTADLPDSNSPYSYAMPVVMSADGARAFFLDYYARRIYKLETGVVTTIDLTLNPYDANGVGSAFKILTTADGEWVYFSNEPVTYPTWKRHLYRIRHNDRGNGAERVYDAGAQRISDFAISADGDKIALIVGTETYASLMVGGGGAAFQTRAQSAANDGGVVAMSGDGSTIVYAFYGSGAKFHSIKADGTGDIPLVDANADFRFLSLSFDGAKFFYRDDHASQLVKTDGTGIQDLFTPLAYLPASSGGLTADGGELFFLRQWSLVPPASGYDAYLYRGYLNPGVRVGNGPVIESISFNPPAMPRGDPDAKVVLTIKVTDPGGLSQVSLTADVLLNGQPVSGSTEAPAYVEQLPNDLGTAPDAVAGDGVFTAYMKPGAKINELDQVTVRVGAQDDFRDSTVADATLKIGS